MHCSKCQTPLDSLCLYEQLHHLETCCPTTAPAAVSETEEVSGNEEVKCPFCGREIGSWALDWRWRHVDRCSFRADLERLRALEEKKLLKRRIQKERLFGPLRRFLAAHGVARYAELLVSEKLTLERLFLLKQPDLELLKIPRSSAERLWEALRTPAYRISLANLGKQNEKRRKQTLCFVEEPALDRLACVKKRRMPRYSSDHDGCSAQESCERETVCASDSCEDIELYRNGYTQLAGALQIGRDMLRTGTGGATLPAPTETIPTRPEDAVEVVDLCDDGSDLSGHEASTEAALHSSSLEHTENPISDCSATEAPSTAPDAAVPASLDRDSIRFRSIRDAIKADSALYERILLLDCVPLRAIMETLAAKHVSVSTQLLMRFLESEGISFSR